MELWRFLGEWHPRLVQFPLVLLLAGLLFDLAGLLFRSLRARWAAVLLTGAGTLSLLFAFICGIYAEIWAGRAGVPQHPMELHELAANLAAWGFVLLFAWRILLASPTAGEATENRRWLALYTCTGLAWYTLLALTAYLGGQLVFSYGAAVSGASANTVLTLEDLATLASRQTDLNLRYSEWMHHIFGFMTLGLSASLLAQALFPRLTPRLRWIVPAFLLAGGIFLFFKADQDLYTFTDPRQWRDREVQLHKSLAVIMTTVGAVGLWKLFRPPAPGAAESCGAPPEGRQSNSKLVAVLALIGGALLFTHVHSVAPYANVAAGVYIAHVVLGLVALSIGATRILQDFFPARRRPLAVAFAALMLAESLLLITYNEGLPWYIGYGRYNRWPPAGMQAGTVAPFRGFRAALAIDPLAGSATVHLLESQADRPVDLSLAGMPVLVLTRGYNDIALPLTRIDTGAFQARSAVLAGSTAFGARLMVRTPSGEQTGYFDPWVTPAIAGIPPNELAAFQCPMHEGIRAAEAGACPLCGMALSPIRPARAAGLLHDPPYHMELAPSPGMPQRPNAATFDLTFRDAAGKALPLAIVHEQPVHLFVVSRDLAWFDHVHPAPLTAEAPAQFQWSYQFPAPGEYLLFADITPAGDRQQFFRTPLLVSAGGVRIGDDAGGTPPALAPRPDAAFAKPVRVVPYPATPQGSTGITLDATKNSTDDSAPVPQVQLLTQPRRLTAGLHATLLFRLTSADGRPVADLMPYLGAAGHCVIVSADTQTVLHCHPQQFTPPTDQTRYGPDVAFHTQFPAAGKYLVVAQFRAGDRLLVAPFVVEVAEPPLPAGLLRFLLNE